MTTAVTWQNATGLVTVIVGRYVLTHWNNDKAEFRLMGFETAENAHEHIVGTVARSEALGNSIPFGPVPVDLPDVLLYTIENAEDRYMSHFSSWPLLYRVAAALGAVPGWYPRSASLSRVLAEG